MREVSHFVVVFPERLLGIQVGSRERIMDALKRRYPHYRFDVDPSRTLADDDEYNVIPILGVVGAGPSADPDQVFMCRPLDPRVIPEIKHVLRSLGRSGVSTH